MWIDVMPFNFNMNKYISNYYSPEYYDILDEKIRQEDKKNLVENHAASKSRLHLHSRPHVDFQLQPASMQVKTIRVKCKTTHFDMWSIYIFRYLCCKILQLTFLLFWYDTDTAPME